MKLTIYNADRIKTGVRNHILFKVPDFYEKQCAIFLKKEKKLTGYKIVIDNTKKRTVGFKSQNKHINGHVQQLAIETGNEFEDVKMGAKIRAIKRGYPTSYAFGDNRPYPKSETEINTIEAGYLIDELHQIADELDIRLIEDDD